LAVDQINQHNVQRNFTQLRYNIYYIYSKRKLKSIFWISSANKSTVVYVVMIERHFSMAYMSAMQTQCFTLSHQQ